MPKDDLINFLRDADDVVRLVTGKRIPDLVKRGIELFGEEKGKEILRILERAKPEPDSPYAVLEVRPDAGDIVVKASYKALVKQYRGNPDKLNKIKEAYEQISGLREWIP